MKIRSSFVTNSSSSSFVIAVKDSDYIGNPEAAKLNETIMAMMTCGDDATIANKAQLTRYFTDRYVWAGGDTLETVLSENAYVRTMYEEFMSRIENGYTIAVHDIDYGDEIFVRVVSSAAKVNDNIVILESEL